MPSAIELDLKHWVRVVPAEGKTQVVTCRSFACFRSGLLAPPELSTEGTEVTTGTAFTIEGSGAWFIAKKAASTEEQLPSLLEVAPATVESINANQLAEGSVTESKFGSESLAAAKVKRIASPTPSGTEKTIVLATAPQVARLFVAAYTGDGVETAIKIKHKLEVSHTIAFAQKSSVKLPSEQPTTALGKWTHESVSEGTYTFTAAPAAKEEVFITVYG